VASWVLDEQEQPQREPMQIWEDKSLPSLVARAG